MKWTLDPKVSLRNERIPTQDADRQQRTATEILRRLNTQPGLILADEVGMGKTYVALAVAVSVVEATRRQRPVVVMVPSSVAEKWPTEWEVFSDRCLQPGHGLRATGTVRRGSHFLKALDASSAERPHLIFLTHGALSNNLNDPFIRLAILRRATLYRPSMANRRRALARFADRLLNDRRFIETLASELLETPTSQWRKVWNTARPHNSLDSDPVPATMEDVLAKIDLDPLRDALLAVPIHRSSSFHERIGNARKAIDHALKDTWRQSLKALDRHLPLLVLDEAHHVKNPTRLTRLLANPEAEEDVDALQGPLGRMFDRMLFLTATPFQLGHHELLNVLTRFHGIRWRSAHERATFDAQMDQLRGALDTAQGTALRFERAWSRIDEDAVGAIPERGPYPVRPDQPEPVRTALEIAAEATAHIESANELLTPWVIRHVKTSNRTYKPGRSILDGGDSDLGLSVTPRSTLPFLLAARAQAVASLHGSAGRKHARSYFAYGLASSFEAYADTRRNRYGILDDQDEETNPGDTISPQLRWYLDRISTALPEDVTDGWAEHPKIAATVDRVRSLWAKGEKTLVFCFYRRTGSALRFHISRALRTDIVERASDSLGLDPTAEEAVLAALDRIGDRLLRSDSRSYQVFRDKVRSLATQLDAPTQDDFAETVIRFMRTPSFLVRFVHLSSQIAVDDLLAGLERPDMSGISLAKRLEAFVGTLGEQVPGEREELMEALRGIQTGGIATTAEHFDPSEIAARHRKILLPNVRLANGEVRRDTRRRLMLAFNTPFFPEVLVASSVMAEGVDLHRDCRHVIHHDLDWNPSTLEQRTGRIDRIGSKAETAGKPVVVYEPYIGGTHDEKMFRVVKDREQWFRVVMGEAADSGELSTERQAVRVPLPSGLANILAMDLSLEQPT